MGSNLKKPFHPFVPGMAMGFTIAAFASMADSSAFWWALSLCGAGVVFGVTHYVRRKSEYESTPAMCLGDLLYFAGITVVGYHVSSAWLASIGA